MTGVRYFGRLKILTSFIERIKEESKQLIARMLFVECESCNTFYRKIYGDTCISFCAIPFGTDLLIFVQCLCILLSLFKTYYFCKYICFIACEMKTKSTIYILIFRKVCILQWAL